MIIIVAGNKLFSAFFCFSTEEEIVKNPWEWSMQFVFDYAC